MGALYRSGLEGVVTAASVSDIKPTKGDVAYRGYDIRERLGDRVGNQGDAHAHIMKGLSRNLAHKIGDTRLHILCEKIERIVFKEKGLHHNLNFYAAPILTMLGIPVDLCTPLFAAARIAGWSAHIVEQLDNNRLVRPRFAYEGPENLTYQPFEARNDRTHFPAV